MHRTTARDQDLLTRVLVAPLAEAASQVVGAADLPEAQTVLLRHAITHRQVLRSWQEQATHLAPDARWVVRGHVVVMARHLAFLIGESRPDLRPADTDLLSWCALSVIESAGHTDAAQPGSIRRLADRVAAVEPAGPVVGQRHGDAEEILRGVVRRACDDPSRLQVTEQELQRWAKAVKRARRCSTGEALAAVYAVVRIAANLPRLSHLRERESLADDVIAVGQALLTP